MEFWTPEDLSYIASAVGIPLYADSSTEAYTRMNYARVCVEIDASKQLVHEFYLQAPSRNTDTSPRCSTVRVVYQWKPKMCSLCKVFGHSTNVCTSQTSSADGPMETNKNIEGFPSETTTQPTPYKNNQTWRVVGRKGCSRPQDDATTSAVSLTVGQAPENVPDPNADSNAEQGDAQGDETRTSESSQRVDKSPVETESAGIPTECPTAYSTLSYVRQETSLSQSTAQDSEHPSMKPLEDVSSPDVPSTLASRIKCIDGISSKQLHRVSAHSDKVDRVINAEKTISGLNAGPSQRSK